MAGDAIALVRALEVVIGHETVEIRLDFSGLDVPDLPSVDAEVLAEQRAIHTLDESVGRVERTLVVVRGARMLFTAGSSSYGSELERAAEFAAVVGERRSEGDADPVGERQDPVVDEGCANLQPSGPDSSPLHYDWLREVALRV